MEKPGEQRIVVFAFIVTEPASECVGMRRRWGGIATPPPPPPQPYSGKILCKNDSPLFSSAGSLEQYMGGCNREGIGLSYRPAQARSSACLGVKSLKTVFIRGRRSNRIINRRRN
jgi:hypothetical protein